MVKKILIGIGVLLVLILGFIAFYTSWEKKQNPLATVTYQSNGARIEIVYSRPSKKGRLIFGEEDENPLLQYGVYWGTGANDATTLESNTTINFGGKELKAGKYQLYSIPGKETWQIILNSDWDKWSGIEPDHNLDVLKTEVTAINNAPEQEQLLISFDQADRSVNTTLNLRWDHTVVKVPILVK